MPVRAPAHGSRRALEHAPHLVFFLFEAVLRRPLPLRVRELASLAGMVLLVVLMGVAFKNDVERRWDVIQSQLKELVD